MRFSGISGVWILVIYSMSRPNLLFTASKSDLKQLRLNFECGIAKLSSLSVALFIFLGLDS